MERRRPAHHSEQAAVHPELLLVDGRRRLDLEIPRRPAARWRRARAGRSFPPRRDAPTCSFPSPTWSTRVDVKRTCGCSATAKKSLDRRWSSRLRFPVSRLAASIVSSILVPSGGPRTTRRSGRSGPVPSQPPERLDGELDRARLAVDDPARPRGHLCVSSVASSLLLSSLRDTLAERAARPLPARPRGACRCQRAVTTGPRVNIHRVRYEERMVAARSLVRGRGHGLARSRRLDLGPDDPAGRRRRRDRMGARFYRERPARVLRLRLQRRRPLAGGDAMERRLGWSRGCARRCSCWRSRSSSAPSRSCWCRRSAAQCADFSDALPGIVDEAQAQRPREPDQRRERLARHAEGAHERDHQRSRQGVGRRGPRRRLGLRRGHARLLGRLPDALRPDRRAARAGLDRQPALPRQAGSATCRSPTGSSTRPRATCSATSPSPWSAGRSTASPP